MENRKALTTVRNKKKELKDLDNHAYQAGSETSSNVVDVYKRQELKGRGCRQFESYLLAQQRSWYDFLMDALVDGGVMKRIDLAINDHTGILDIPELAEKCRKREDVYKRQANNLQEHG